MSLPELVCAFPQQTLMTPMVEIHMILGPKTFWCCLEPKGWTAKLYFMSCKGDWKYLKQSLLLNRHPGSTSICFACLASKSGAYNMTDPADNAAWRRTVWNCPAPWTHAPCFCQMELFHVRKVGYDALHIWHLGVCRDLSHGCNRAIYGLGFTRCVA